MKKWRSSGSGFLDDGDEDGSELAALVWKRMKFVGGDDARVHRQCQSVGGLIRAHAGNGPQWRKG
jgi:hypothetical protein